MHQRLDGAAPALYGRLASVKHTVSGRGSAVPWSDQNTLRGEAHAARTNGLPIHDSIGAAAADPGNGRTRERWDRLGKYQPQGEPYWDGTRGAGRPRAVKRTVH